MRILPPGVRQRRFTRRDGRAEDFARAVLDNLPYAVIAADAARRRLVVNRRAHALLGPPPDSGGVDDWPATYSIDGAMLRPREQNPLRQALHGQRVRVLRAAVGPDEGSRTPVRIDGVTVNTDDGELQGAAVVMRELDDDHLPAERSRIAVGALENLALPVAVFSANSGELVYTNASWDRMFGYADGGALGLHISVVHRLGEEERPGERLRTIVRSLHEEAGWSGRLDSIRRDGVEFWCTVTISRLTDDRAGDLWIAAYPLSAGV